ncbi:TetR/AcrR family transcriptional regulator [Actinospica robiniae]|uniref:TetR/AcrR family transcriptional regulator n=1 Tax=Actinospica robiniae TaxID=304901 RepID=UPI000422512F|nr:TetR/AcrR family transcriptional regulator [Actinospica robiniae]
MEQAGTDGSGTRRHHGNRHGRSEDARRAVLQAADDLLVKRGFGGVTVEGVAAAAGVGKQTIYRWWASKTDILLDAFLEDAAEDLVEADHGDLGRDLREHLNRLARFLREDHAGAVFRALIGHAQHDPQFAATLRARYLDAQRRRDQLPLDRAAARGELPADFDSAAALDRLVGPLYHRVLITGDPVDEDFIDGLVTAFTRSIQP